MAIEQYNSDRTVILYNSNSGTYLGYYNFSPYFKPIFEAELDVGVEDINKLLKQYKIKRLTKNILNIDEKRFDRLVLSFIKAQMERKRFENHLSNARTRERSYKKDLVKLVKPFKID